MFPKPIVRIHSSFGSVSINPCGLKISGMSLYQLTTPSVRFSLNAEIGIGKSGKGVSAHLVQGPFGVAVDTGFPGADIGFQGVGEVLVVHG
jgi:hypothetical protein